MNLAQIEALTRAYAAERETLTQYVEAMREIIAQAQRQHLPKIRKAIGRTGEAHAALAAAIEAAQELFERPRTRTFAGVKVGWQKQKGKVVIADEAATIRRIRELLPKDQAELLVRQTESVHKPGVYDLIAADLKRLGIRIEDDTDAIVIKPVDSDIDKLVAALLKDTEQLEQAA
jgi:hypothetical protein